ncbi:glycosyltransferase [Methylomonas sp. MED-D]|uniref:glycosyltransferase n=1 Tax=unclassified Methylomonas TaxID=2608980 RepID=UPI0028A53DE8|nr:glycosyltransferase [Methylomonas sp. MV1]MDT4328983.1 glycosyltransferase [Methylomonas sp. MV1]
MNSLGPKLSIVVGTYNRIDQIKRCVESIQRETTTPYKLYITDAGSTDGTVEYLESVRSETNIPLLIGKLLGQAKAYNDVFSKIDTPYVCWLSDDNVVVNRGLDIALKILENNKEIGMVGLKTKDVQGPFVDAPYIGGISDIGVLNINQGMLTTDVLKAVGGFSEAFRDYGIDPDLTAKVLFSGFDLVYTKAVSLHHFRNWNTDKSSSEYSAIREKNERARRLYLEKYRQFQFRSSGSQVKQNVKSIFKSRISNLKGGNGRSVKNSPITRDFMNILGGRFISVLDPLLSMGKTYHLRQHCPIQLLPNQLPVDPDMQ